MAENLITKERLLDLGRVESRETDQFSFSVLAFKLAGKVNAVSKRHQQTSKKIWHFAFPQIKEEKRVVIDYVTNAVHPLTWIAKPMDEFFRKYLGKNYQKEIDSPKLWERLEVQDDQQKLNQNLWQARLECKERLFEEVRGAKDERSERKRSERFPDPKSLPFFLGFARRFAPYKRVYLLISDLDRLSKILTHPDSPIYLFVAGKAHPADPIGKKYLKEIIEAARDPRLQGHLIFLPDYNLELAKILIPGVDVWLNTPLPPMEASGTSGMKAALNGVLNACVADGWWWETQIKNQKSIHSTSSGLMVSRVEPSKIKNFGWTIGSSDPPFPEVFGRLESENDQQTAAVLYDLLETQIVPLYYDQTDGIPLRWIEKIKKSLITLAPQFNTQRLLKEYQERLYK